MSPYEQYILSPHWSELREKALNRAGRKCESCGERKRLHGHHLQYRNFIDCTEEDITCLCETCHAQWHECFSSSVITSRDFVLGFLAGLRVNRRIQTAPKEPKPKLKRPIQIPPKNYSWTRIKDSVLNDPKVTTAAKTLDEHEFKLWLRVYYTGKKKKGVLCGHAIKAYAKLRKPSRNPEWEPF